MCFFHVKIAILTLRVLKGCLCILCNSGNKHKFLHNFKRAKPHPAPIATPASALFSRQACLLRCTRGRKYISSYTLQLVFLAVFGAVD